MVKCRNCIKLRSQIRSKERLLQALLKSDYVSNFQPTVYSNEWLVDVNNRVASLMSHSTQLESQIQDLEVDIGKAIDKCTVLLTNRLNDGREVNASQSDCLTETH